MAKKKTVPKLERHPLSAAYADITGQEWLAFSNGVKDYYNGRPIVLFEGKVLDGWQLYRACVEHQIVPELWEFQGNALGAERFVEIHNDHRRHMTAEAIQRQTRDRRDRVAKLRESGMSIRAIADEESVSSSTIQTDLDPTVQGRTVEPPDGKITGKDGRKRPARRSSKPKTPKPPKLCRRCKTINAPSCDKCREKALAYREAMEALVPPPKTGKLEFEGAVFDRMRQSLTDLQADADKQLTDSKEHSSAERNKIVAESINLTTLCNMWQNRLKRKREGQRHA